MLFALCSFACPSFCDFCLQSCWCIYMYTCILFYLYISWTANKIFTISLASCFTFNMYMSLTNWGWDKMAAIFQTTCSNTLSWMKMYEFRLKFHWSLFLRVQLTIFQYWFRRYCEMPNTSGGTYTSVGWHIVRKFNMCRPEHKCRVAHCLKINVSAG